MRVFTRSLIIISLCLVVTLSTNLQVNATEACLDCHNQFTPEIVDQWEQSKHYEEQVGCYNCHQVSEDNPSALEHSIGWITSVVSPKSCENCHSEEVKQYSQSKHAWTAFIGPLKPWYSAMVNDNQDPFDVQTALETNPEEFVRAIVTPLFPDSGALENAGFLDDSDYNHENQVAGCMTCHGTYVVAEKGEILDGWPNTGVGRVNPDGSLGSCSSCHTRHVFSREEARKPETCGQCHLGPDHPQMEIYEESKHGNIYFSSGESWNWEDDDWGVGDINSPTCATCHMSGFNQAVDTTHDSGARLYWEQQSKKSIPQWDSAELIPLGRQSPDIVQAEAGRAEMKSVCGVCHASSWVDGYLDSYDNTISDYNKVHDYSLSLLNVAYEEKLADPSNPIDETPEIIYYYIWHHDGRRWRMGASMMGPDWTHWNGAVDALLDKLNTLEGWITDTREVQNLYAKVTETEKQLNSANELLNQALVQIEELQNVEPVSQLPNNGNSLLLAGAIILIVVLLAIIWVQTRKRL